MAYTIDWSKGYHGHPGFYKFLEEAADTHSTKNKDYTHGGDPLGNFKRVSAILALWGYNIPPWLVAAIFSLKQLDASMWMLGHGYEGEVETVEKRLLDEGVFAGLKYVLVHEEKASTYEAN